MPQILVVAETGEENDVVYRERLSLSDFDSAFFGAQFAQRVGWAVHDADLLEHRRSRRAEAAPRGSAVRPDPSSGTEAGA